jgi:hypothetical protein
MSPQPVQLCGLKLGTRTAFVDLTLNVAPSGSDSIRIRVSIADPITSIPLCVVAETTFTSATTSEIPIQESPNNIQIGYGPEGVARILVEVVEGSAPTPNVSAALKVVFSTSAPPLILPSQIVTATQSVSWVVTT